MEAVALILLLLAGVTAFISSERQGSQMAKEHPPQGTDAVVVGGLRGCGWIAFAVLIIIIFIGLAGSAGMGI